MAAKSGIPSPFKAGAEFLDGAYEIVGDGIAGDFNGDGKLDVAIANGPWFFVFPANGDDTFGAAVGFMAGSDPVYAVVGDFNGDGKPDIAMVNASSNSVTVLTNTSP